MGLACPVIVFISCLCLIGQIAGTRGGNHKGREKGASSCRGWENDLRNNLSAPGISDYLKGLHESIPNLSPGCVQSFSRNVSHSNLKMLMEFLNIEYDNLKPGTRKQIYKWVEVIYTKVLVPLNGWNSKTNEKPTHMPNSNNGQAKGKGKGKGHWITLDVVNILGRFILQAPTSTLKSIASSKNSTICQLFNHSSDLLDKLHDLTPVQARIFFEGLQKCVNVDIMKEIVIANLGQLACFYPVRQLKSLDMRARKALQGKLLNCTRNLREIYQMLVKNININNLTAQELKYLGASAIGLKVSQMSNLSDEAVVGALEELKKVKGWSKGQIKALVKKYQKVENVTADKLKYLGVLVSGLGAKTFDKFKGQELLNVFSQKDLAESPNAMLPVQKKSIMKAILQSVKIDSVLESLPESLVSQIPVDKLKNADNVINLDFLSKNKAWNMGQSVMLINRIKDQLNDAKNISKLKAVVKGISCNLINSLKADAMKALANNPLVSSNQIRCFSSKFFENQMARRPNYFSNLTLEDINEFLVSYMIFQPNIKELKLIPRSLCPNMVELISQINITMLPRSSPRRKQLLDYATDCLSLTASSMTEDQSNSLGSLVCAFSAEEMKNLNTTVFPAIVDQLRECGRFDKEKKSILREKILAAYPPLANWTVDELIQLHGLLAVLQLDDFKLIPNNDDIKAALQEILSSHKSAENFIPPDFDNSPNFSSLYRKLFDILNNKSDDSRRRRATGQTKCPISEEIEALGEANNLWTADQLKCISVEDFIDSLDTLTEVTGFNSDQLKALTLKASQAFGMNFTNDQLASLKKITLGFTDDGVEKYFTKPDIDTIGAISDYKEWSSDEYSSQAKTIVQNFLDGRDDSTLSSTDLVGMGYFLCTRRSDQIKKINATAYSSAAKDIGNKMCPKTETLTALKEKAVEAFSNVRTWTGAQLQEIGVVAAGLSAEEVSKLNESAVSFLTPAAVSQFPPKVFSAMKIEQLSNLGPENYGAVTEAQKKAMSKEQLDALNENAGYARVIGGAGSIYWNPVMMLTLLVLSLTAALH